MLTFSEALVQIKSGLSLKSNTWPRGRFVRMYTKFANGVFEYELRLYTPTDSAGILFFPTQAEMLGQSWSVA